MLSETFLKNSNVRVSNLVRFFDEKHIRFNSKSLKNIYKQRGVDYLR